MLTLQGEISLTGEGPFHYSPLHSHDLLITVVNIEYYERLGVIVNLRGRAGWMLTWELTKVNADKRILKNLIEILLSLLIF